MKSFKLSPDIKLDLQRLIETRLLITASSGGGKSMTIRTLLEATHNVFPQIILDVEGEFSTLREKFDYILVGKNGDIPCDVRTAQLLARKLLELNASAIIDLYELKHSDKHRFVRLFIEALVDSPKDLWGPRLLVIDEAHQFCPEKGAGASEAWEAVIDVCEKGRKRGLGAILATQRLSKLNKDAAAECQNKIIGLANIDIDRDRSAKELGFTKKEDILSLRDLEAGEFYVIGPALSRTVEKTRIDLAKTSHPKIGRHTAKAPVATAKVKQMLEKLKDLPQESEKELKTQAAMVAEINRLKAELRKALGFQVKPVDTRALEKEAAERGARALKELKDRVTKALNEPSSIKWPKVQTTGEPTPQVVKGTIGYAAASPANRKIADAAVKDEEEKSLGKGEQEILKFLSINPTKRFSKIQIGTMTGYAGTSGTFNTYMSRLKTLGYVDSNSYGFCITPEGQRVASSIPGSMRSGKEALEAWLPKLGGGPAKIYGCLLNNPGSIMPKEEVGEATGLVSTSGTFNTYVSKLVTLGLVVRENGQLGINPEIQDL